MPSVVELQVIQGVAEVAMDNPPYQTLSNRVLAALYSTLEQVASDPGVTALVLCGSGADFCAGSELDELADPTQRASLRGLVAMLENYPKTTVAALHGKVHGGGLELAMACSARVAVGGSELGLPDVALGLLPSAGGTRRLPQLIGADRALKMITSGRSIGAAEALDCGLIDALVAADVIAAARQHVARSAPLSASEATPVNTTLPTVSADFFATWRTSMERRSGGQMAPRLAVDAVEYGLSSCRQDALDREAELGEKCSHSAQALAMQYAASAERICRVGNLDGSVTANVNTVGIVGAGTMGVAIAMVFASADIGVVLVDASQDTLQKGLQSLTSTLQRAVAAGQMDSAQSAACWFNVRGSSDYEDLKNVDLVVEAAFEDLSVKQSIFAKLDRLCDVKTILATNTSYLDIDAIAAVTQRREKVFGMHFFSPANRMKLLEVVAATQTSKETLSAALSVAKRIDKIACVVGVCFGFVGNRMFSNYTSESNLLLLEGAEPEQIDAAMTDWGMAMGPLAVADLSGLDSGYRARQMQPDAPRDERYFRPANLLVEQGRLGQKTAAGFYRYRQRQRENDGVVMDLIGREADRLGIAQRRLDPEEIQQRLIYTLINEGARILDQGIARRASDIDVIWINGYGFPRWRGGPMYLADRCGLQAVVDGLKRYHPSPIFDYQRPAAKLVRMAQAGENFAD